MLPSQTVRMGRFGFYNNCLNVGLGSDGLHLSIWRPLSIWHHRLKIPWEDLSVSIETGLLSEFGELRFRKVPSVSMRVSKGLCQAISKKSIGAFTKVKHPSGRTRRHSGLLKKALIVLFTGGLFSSGIFLFFANTSHLPGLYRMAHRPAFTDGWVNGKEPKNHHQVTYTFNVDGRSYDGSNSFGDAFDQIKIGDKLRVTYDPEDPNVSMLLGNADEDVKVLSVLGGIFSLFGGFLFAVPLLRLGFLTRRHS